MKELKKLVLNGQEYSLPYMTVAQMEAAEHGDDLYICTSHTAAQLQQALQDGRPVLAILRNQGTGVCQQHFFFMDDRRLVVGDALADGGWQHVPGSAGYYLDGDAGNREPTNEVWIMY